MSDFRCFYPAGGFVPSDANTSNLVVSGSTATCALVAAPLESAPPTTSDQNNNLGASWLVSVGTGTPVSQTGRANWLRINNIVSAGVSLRFSNVATAATALGNQLSVIFDPTGALPLPAALSGVPSASASVMTQDTTGTVGTNVALSGNKFVVTAKFAAPLTASTVDVQMTVVYST